MDLNILIQNLSENVVEIKKTQMELNDELLSIERDLNKSLEDQAAINTKLKEVVLQKRIEKSTPQIPVVAPEVVIQKAEHPQPIDTTAQLEKLLQGSLDALGDKISDRLMGMLKELKSLPIEVRATRIHEIKQAADAELVDLSALYKHQEVESNIEEVGVDEKEAKGIDKNLERLRKLRQMKK
ncbi:MAG: hypothetical protein HQL24_02600 [Candidatus Omnitrophica bacterium]|nr:hypothetical protein [Candidatus Omnitrophota bacterium]